MAEVLIWLSTAAAFVPGHDTPDGVILRAVQVVVRSDFVEIRYQLGLHDNMIRRELQALSEPGAAIPTDVAETIARYRDVIAPLLPKRMRVTIDGNPVRMTVHRADIVRQPHRQLELVYHIPFTPGTVPAKFVLWDDNFQGVPGYHFAAMRARGNAAVLGIGADKPLDRLPSVPEPGQLATVPLEPMRGLAAYVCVAGVSPPATGGPTPALAANPTVDAKKPSIPDTRPGDARPTQAVATTPRPDAEPATPVATGTLQRSVWPLSCGIVAILLAVAWWWTSRNPRKEPS